jgi:lipopolysaccharide export system permease protein
MKLMRRYYMKEFAKLLSVIAFGLALIFSLLDMIDKIDDFVPDRMSVLDFIHYAALNLPKYLYYLLPMSLLICSLFVFSQASRYKEIAVIKAAGGRLKGLFSQFIFLGVLFSLFSFFLGEFVMPNFSERALDLRKRFMEGGEKLSFKEGTLWLRARDGALVRMEIYIPDSNRARGVSIFMMDSSSLKKRVEAEEAFWDKKQDTKGIWKLKNAIVYDLEEGTVTAIPEMDYTQLESPDLFSKSLKAIDEMGIRELYKYTKRLQNAGVNNTKLIVDLHSKIAYPLTNLFLMLLGISFSVMGRVGGGLFAAGIGFLISVLYWLAYTFVLSMGYARILPPLFAAWIVPILFGVVAAYFFYKIPE